MKTKSAAYFRLLASLAPLLAGASLCAAPLTWFPGPTLDSPISSAATTVASGFGNVLIGGDSYYDGYGYPISYPENLIATNAYWGSLGAIYSVNIAPGAVANADYILLYGGSDGTNSTSAALAYSLTGDNVPTPLPMSVPRSYLGYAPDASGNAYAIGGLDDTGQPLATVERCNLDTGIWTNITELPAARYNFPAVFDRTNRIYIFGGRTNTSAGAEIASVLRYSTQSRTWTAVASLPVPTAGSAATLGVDGKIYVVGGVTGGATTNLVQVYNPSANTWTLSTPLPEGLNAASIGVDSLGRLLVMGGLDMNGNAVADVWRSQRLGVPDAAPTFTQYPGTNGTYLATYASSISATGNPQPTYLLISGPDGMQVDGYTGAITWTPQANHIGTNLVTIRATNYAGFADWGYNITVPNPPPTLPTNLAVVSVTAHSVTLSWSPQSPVVGAVTYRVYLRHVTHSPRGSGATITYTQIGNATSLTTITITGLTPGLSQGYYLTVSGAGGGAGYASISATTLSVQPPTNLRLTGLTSTSVSLAWDPPPGPIPAVSYDLRDYYNFGYTGISIGYGTNITNTAFTITGLTPGAGHTLAVRAHDAEGYTSAYSYISPISTFFNPEPVSPQLSGAAPAVGGGFQFTASEGSSVLQTVLIQATTNPADPNSWIQIGSLLPTTNPFTFTDSNAAQFPARFYRVLAP